MVNPNLPVSQNLSKTYSGSDEKSDLFQDEYISGDERELTSRNDCSSLTEIAQRELSSESEDEGKIPDKKSKIKKKGFKEKCSTGKTLTRQRTQGVFLTPPFSFIKKFKEFLKTYICYFLYLHAGARRRRR
ncbi:hypothetical protein AVEN_98034-1 [Araneus ventricosus]|uniref:Uncharacterized protein n=1 Tax=Araneus ventricosus TaxID=182803 RepID=A0A4Y2G4X8_ARAVE|nr:hypothetical protein AVEN_98034-1 [Araneus ventricosus]